jgi:arginine/lysine/ornithine decarboxylase
MDPVAREQDFGQFVDSRRELNEQRAEEELGRGPARDDADAAPIGEAIQSFHRRNDLSFGIPAHRSGTGSADPDAAAWTGADAFHADVGMNNGVDNRHQSWKVEPTAMELFAEAVGADETLFSTNGSSENVHVAMMAAVRPGETIVMARNGHKSAFAALVISGAQPVYVDPVYDERWELAHGVEPGELDAVLAAHPEARAAMVFTPSYYGVSADVSALAQVAHAHDVPLITDDAWGLDYSFCSRLPPSAIESGADLAIGSVHKTLNGFSQTSVLSRKGERIDPARLSLVFELEQSTSASALLLSSIDAARRQFEHEGEKLLGDAIDLAEALRRAIAEVDGIALMGEEVLGPGAIALDPTHVTFDVRDLGLTGYQAADWLQQHRGVHVELSDHRRLMTLISYADTQANANRLLDALRALSDEHRGAEPAPRDVAVPYPRLRLESAMLPREAYLGPVEMVPWREAPGRISAEMICPYPPGIPVAAPGEVLTREVVEYLEQVIADGAMVEGAADESLAELRVVATS